MVLCGCQRCCLLLPYGNRTQTQGNNVVPAPGMSKHVDTQVPQSVKKPRIVILGSGWGAMSFIKGMSKKDRYVFLTSRSAIMRM